jgi:GTPase
MAERNIPSSSENKPLTGLLSRAPERAILVGVGMPGNGWPVEESLDELAQLATTAGVTCADRVIQRLARPHPGTLLGSGKIQEIADLVRYHDCDAVIFDLELSPGQHRTLESALETQVLDRTALILMTPPAARTPLPEGQAVAPVRAGREGGFRAATCPTYRPGGEGGHHGRTRI